MVQLVFATNNIHKLREINHILGDSFSLLSLKDIGMEIDIPENEATLEGNAMYKAKHIYELTAMNVFADDTGLEIDVLGGLPGVHSARFAGESKDFSANIEKALAMMGMAENRNARFRTVIALILDGKEFLFEGVSEGRIISDKRGSEGFGYDPVFVPEGETRTFAEMTLAEKNRISHRARAFEKLREFLVLHADKRQ
ncbi:MAG: RdgB/HAM1 family non-canonical purine NTP pyrophosphatase [Bacteroidales bacterium]|jgi:XTP/dITP diphosphohydrolase|nr:RdgB/HAM1 family non-canonical purine NTP pyrophosphatase [Bacteroidales bacterium]